MSDAFAILLACGGFVLGVAVGLFLATTRHDPIQKGKPVSAKRMRSLWVIDPLLERGPNLEHQHITVYPTREPATVTALLRPDARCRP